MDTTCVFESVANLTTTKRPCHFQVHKTQLTSNSTPRKLQCSRHKLITSHNGEMASSVSAFLPFPWLKNTKNILGLSRSPIKVIISIFHRFVRSSNNFLFSTKKLYSVYNPRSYNGYPAVFKSRLNGARKNISFIYRFRKLSDAPFKGLVMWRLSGLFLSKRWKWRTDWW